MKAVLINGSPRKNWNTHKLLLEAEKGAKETGAGTEMIHLFHLKYTDCKSCFACKLRGNQTEGICAIHDDLKPVLDKIADAGMWDEKKKSERREKQFPIAMKNAYALGKKLCARS